VQAYQVVKPKLGGPGLLMPAGSWHRAYEGGEEEGVSKGRMAQRRGHARGGQVEGDRQ
jgi:hypothetical protein